MNTAMRGGGESKRFAPAITQVGDEDAEVIASAVASATDGDRDALRYLYIRYADSVFGYVRGIVRDEGDAEDITHQLFAKLVTILPKYERQEVPFSAWILRVSRNLAFDHIRHRRTVPCDEVRATERDYDDMARQRSLGLREALASLPQEQRAVILLRHVLGMSPSEIAARLGKSEAAIHGLHHRARAAMRKALSERGAAPATMATTLRQ